jgi:hypothetical protein
MTRTSQKKVQMGLLTVAGDRGDAEAIRTDGRRRMTATITERNERNRKE